MHTTFNAWDEIYFKVEKNKDFNRIEIQFEDDGGTLFLALEDDIAKRLALALTNTILQEG